MSLPGDLSAFGKNTPAWSDRSSELYFHSCPPSLEHLTCTCSPRSPLSYHSRYPSPYFLIPLRTSKIDLHHRSSTLPCFLDRPDFPSGKVQYVTPSLCSSVPSIQPVCPMLEMRSRLAFSPDLPRESWSSSSSFSSMSLPAAVIDSSGSSSSSVGPSLHAIPGISSGSSLSSRSCHDRRDSPETRGHSKLRRVFLVLHSCLPRPCSRR